VVSLSCRLAIARDTKVSKKKTYTTYTATCFGRTQLTFFFIYLISNQNLQYNVVNVHLYIPSVTALFVVPVLKVQFVRLIPKKHKRP
jgi:Na+/melibiose symporter-like transporter